ncbi:MAG TPA: outer membrane beta-barrel protein [Bacteroidales bacterium]|nr:outer membrane beta-barrel protein [Bacteroidales bacterium]
MADRKANIDLVFRNGLKDYEVLPPPEVWENIHPSIHTGQKSSYIPLFKAAAAVGVVVTLSIAAYQWGERISNDQLNELVAANQESVSPEVSFVNPPVSNPIVNIKRKSGSDINIEKAEKTGDPDVVLAETLSESNNIGVSLNLKTESSSLPGIQDPLSVKYAKVTSPELEAVTYQLLQENIEAPEIQRWSVSAIASPTYYSQFSSSGNELAQQVMESDQTRVSYTGGVGLSYKITSRFSIQSGLYYSSLGQEVGGVNAYSGFKQYDNSKSGHNFEILTANGTVFSSNSDVFLNSSNLPARVQSYYTNDVFDPVKENLSYVSSTIFKDLSFLELPLILRYKIVDRKIDLNVIGGMSYNFLVNNSVYAVTDGGKYPVGTTEGLNTVSLSSSLGMGMEYKLSENLSLNLEPTFRYYLNPFNSTNSGGFHPYSLGIFSGVSYKF